MQPQADPIPEAGALRARYAKWGIIAIVVGVLAVNIAWLSRHWNLLRRLGPGKMAPDFELVAASGDRVRLSDLRGRVVLIDFWSIRCGPCWRGLDHINAIAKKFEGKKVTVLGIHVEGGEAAAGRVSWALRQRRKFLRFPVLFDNGEVERKYTVRALPTTVLIDKTGKVRKVWLGLTSSSKIAGEIQRLL